MLKYAVIVAAGRGTRMGSSTPKQFMMLSGKPVLWHTLHSFFSAFSDIQIVLVSHKDYLLETQAIAADFGLQNITICTGGETRFESVKNGLARIKEDGIIFVHDAVRCLVSKALIRKCYDEAVEKGNAVPSIAVSDSIRIADEKGNHTIDRENVRIIQTPQTFQSAQILKAFKQEYEPSFTDEANVVEKKGFKINLIDGDATNIKITHAADLIVAEQLLKGKLLT